jgi:hypothetical protein
LDLGLHRVVYRHIMVMEQMMERLLENIQAKMGAKKNKHKKT